MNWTYRTKVDPNKDKVKLFLDIVLNGISKEDEWYMNADKYIPSRVQESLLKQLVIKHIFINRAMVTLVHRWPDKIVITGNNVDLSQCIKK